MGLSGTGCREIPMRFPPGSDTRGRDSLKGLPPIYHLKLDDSSTVEGLKTGETYHQIFEDRNFKREVAD